MTDSPTPAQIAEHLLLPYLNHAVRMYESGYASRDDIVVEAIAEDLAVKLELFTDLDRICKPGTILATTTSSLPITECAKATSRPEWVIGMHFFNPAPVMKLVEVVTT